MFSAFQSNAFQNNAFQIGRGSSTDGGGKPYNYQLPYHKYREDELQRQRLAEKRADLKRVESELAQAEADRQKKLASAKKRLEAKNAAKQLAALEAQLQEEINRLRNERIWLMRLIDDEEAMLVLLLSLPLH